MKSAAAQFALGCGVSILLGTAALGALLFTVAGTTTWTTDPAPDPPAVDEGPLPESFATRVSAVREFSRQEVGGEYRLTYGFIDHHARRHRVSCVVKHADLDSERRAYGYDEGVLRAEYNRRLLAMVEREIRARGLAPYFRIRFYGWGAHEWTWEVAGDVGDGERERAHGEITRIERWLKGPFLGERDEVLAGLYRPHGILLRGDTLSIDYGTVADRGVPATRDCFEALRRAGEGSTVRQYLGLFVAFFQELKYELPPGEEEGRKTHGLWVPGDVLVRGRGDCDSKSAAFAAMWRHMPSALLFIILPNHVLVAVEAPPWPGEHFVRLGNRTFLFGEVAGDAKIRPGFAAPEGNYEYVLFEPSGR